MLSAFARLQDEFPVREDLSEISDDDTSLAKPPQPVKSTVPSFKLKNDSDLFGLGLEEAGPKESSEEGKAHTLFPLLLLSCVRHLFLPKSF